LVFPALYFLIQRRRLHLTDAQPLIGAPA